MERVVINKKIMLTENNEGVAEIHKKNHFLFHCDILRV